MENVMIGIETLGKQPGSVILSIGAVEFSTESGAGLGRKAYYPIDVFSCLMAGLTVEQEAMEWWKKKKESPFSIYAAPFRLGIALMRFSEFVRDAEYIWAKSSEFDLVLLREAYKVTGIPWSLDFRRFRDVRTIEHIASLFGAEISPIEEEVHHPLEDAVNQAQLVVSAVASLRLTGIADVVNFTKLVRGKL